jgi:hypothetical protein
MSDNLRVSWDAVNWNGSQGTYEILRAYDGSSYSQVGYVSSGTTQYDDTGLLDGEQYSYKVRATNSAGSSTSSAASGTTSLPAPSGVSASASGDDITVSWTDNSDNEDGFEILRSHDGSAYSQVASVGAGTASYSDTGLLDGEQYTYKVRAYTEHTTST